MEFTTGSSGPRQKMGADGKQGSQFVAFVASLLSLKIEEDGASMVGVG